MSELEITGVLRQAALEAIGNPKGDMRLSGYVFNDAKQRFPDGYAIYTAIIVTIYNDEVFVTKSGSVYRVEDWRTRDILERNDPRAILPEGFEIERGKPYRLRRDRELAFGGGEPAGTICYRCDEHDYGLVRDDEAVTGRKHVAMTKNADGSGPLFTVPLRDLEPVQ